MILSGNQIIEGRVGDSVREMLRVAKGIFLRNIVTHSVVHKSPSDRDGDDALPVDSPDRYVCVRCGTAGVALMNAKCSGRHDGGNGGA